MLLIRHSAHLVPDVNWSVIKDCLTPTDCGRNSTTTLMLVNLVPTGLLLTSKLLESEPVMDIEVQVQEEGEGSVMTRVLEAA